MTNNLLAADVSAKHMETIESETLQPIALETPQNVSVTNISLELNLDNGSITGNLDETEKIAYQIAAYYRNIIYVASNVADEMKLMKKDRSKFAKAIEAINAERIRISNEYMMPIDAMKKKTDNICRILEDARETLDSKVKEFEKRNKKEKSESIRAYYDSIAAEVDVNFRENLYNKLYDPKWENATSTQKMFQESLLKGVSEYVVGYNSLNQLNSDFIQNGIEKFQSTLSLPEALQLMNSIQSQKDELLKKEKERIEKEARIKAEQEAAEKIEAANRIAREAAEKIEAAKRAAQAAEVKAQREAAEKIEAVERIAREAAFKAQQEIAEKVEAARRAACKEAEDKYADIAPENDQQKLVSASETTIAEHASETIAQNRSFSPNAATHRKGVINVSFNELSWSMVEAFCEENCIPYILQ